MEYFYNLIIKIEIKYVNMIQRYKYFISCLIMFQKIYKTKILIFNDVMPSNWSLFCLSDLFNNLMRFFFRLIYKIIIINEYRKNFSLEQLWDPLAHLNHLQLFYTICSQNRIFYLTNPCIHINLLNIRIYKLQFYNTTIWLI